MVWLRGLVLGTIISGWGIYEQTLPKDKFKDLARGQGFRTKPKANVMVPILAPHFHKI